MKTVGAVWRQAQKRLEAGGVEPAGHEGRALVARALGLQPRELLLQEQDGFVAERDGALQEMVARRLTGEPLGYVLGYAPFWSRDWRVGPGVLIPRPDTEVLVREALAALGGAMRVAEVGVGSGCVAGSILLERPGVTAVATDVSDAALRWAEGNLRDAGVAARCELMKADVLAGVEGPFDAVVSNPPYIADHEWAGLETGVRDFEPEGALRAGVHGLDVYERLVPAARAVLRRGGRLLVEIGWMQGAAVGELFGAQGFKDVRVVKDLAGRDRVVMGEK